MTPEKRPTGADRELAMRLMPLLRDNSDDTLSAAASVLMIAREQGRQEIINCEACLPHDPCKMHSGR